MKRKTIHFLTATLDNTSEQRPTQRIEIPRTIMIGGQEISVNDHPELAKLVSLVRQDTSIVEKNKLYSQYNKLQQQVEALNNVTVIDPSTGNAMNEGAISNLVEAKMEGVINTFKTLIQPLLDANMKTESQTLEEYRNKLIQENTGKIVPQMVVGNSVEELNANLEAAKTAFESVRGMFGVQTNEEVIAAQRANATQGVSSGSNETWGSAHNMATTAAVQQPQNPTQAPAQAPTQTQAPVQQTATQPQQAVQTAPKMQATPTNLFPGSPATAEVTDLPTITAGSMSMDEFKNKREELMRGIQQYANL